MSVFDDAYTRCVDDEIRLVRLVVTNYVDCPGCGEHIDLTGVTDIPSIMAEGTPEAPGRVTVTVGGGVVHRCAEEP